MPDIFLSYTRDDRTKARHFAESFEAHGFSVWWDVALRSGEDYDRVTERALRDAKAVVVLWSKKSVDSRWVRAEATQAQRNKTLIPAMIEDCVRPVMFELTQAADLSHWSGDPADTIWLTFLADVKRVVETSGEGSGDSHRDTAGNDTRLDKLEDARNPSICVLPFTCFSEESAFKFLTEAMTEDLITMLARIPGFVVIARQSSFAYQGRSVDSRQIGRELGVHYIVEGSLRPTGRQVRVGAQLIDATTGAQRWADRFDGQAENVLELQDQIARAIASRIEPELVRAEFALVRRRRDAKPNAWSCFRQGAGLISLKGWSEETLTEAAALLRQATALDPDFALARAQLALFLSLGARLGLVADGAAAVAEARAEAERAVTIDHDASEVLGYAGCALAELGDVQRGCEILERAIENDPSNAQAWVALGSSLCFFEKSADVGLEKLRHGMRLSPRDHRLGFWGTFYALALARHRRLREAHEEIRTACRRDPQFYVARIVLAFTAVGLGSKEEAIAALREARRLRPRLSLEEIQLFVGRGGAARLAPLWRDVPKPSR
ncbi:MAG: TIR domain-containing protein [Rhizomicrobium sp.]|jgi:adenylate cyclase